MKIINPMHAKRVAEFERLTAQGMNQEDAAKKIGVTLSAIYQSRVLAKNAAQPKKVIVRRKRQGVVTAIEVGAVPSRLIAFVGSPSEVVDAVRGMQ